MKLKKRHLLSDIEHLFQVVHALHKQIDKLERAKPDELTYDISALQRFDAIEQRITAVEHDVKVADELSYLRTDVDAPIDEIGTLKKHKKTIAEAVRAELDRK